MDGLPLVFILTNNTAMNIFVPAFVSTWAGISPGKKMRYINDGSKNVHISYLNEDRQIALQKKKKDYTNAYPSNNASFLYMPLIIAVINPLHFTNMINKHDFHLL